MLISKIWIFINVILYIGIGILALTMPQYVAHTIGYSLSTPGGIAELKACYGGLMIALAILMGLMLSKQMIADCLVFMTIIYSGFGLGRIIGIIGNQAYDRTTLIYVAFELFSILFSFVLLKNVSS